MICAAVLGEKNLICSAGFVVEVKLTCTAAPLGERNRLARLRRWAREN